MHGAVAVYDEILAYHNIICTLMGKRKFHMYIRA